MCKSECRLVRSCPRAHQSHMEVVSGRTLQLTPRRDLDCSGMTVLLLIKEKENRLSVSQDREVLGVLNDYHHRCFGMQVHCSGRLHCCCLPRLFPYRCLDTTSTSHLNALLCFTLLCLCLVLHRLGACTLCNLLHC